MRLIGAKVNFKMNLINATISKEVKLKMELTKMVWEMKVAM